MKRSLFSDTFVRNEFSTILGKRRSNLWILLVVFVFSIGALAFSRSGIKYLSFKMNDPFIKWIQIPEHGDFDRFRQETEKPAIQQQYQINSSEANNIINQNIYNSKGKGYPSYGRSIAYNSPLLSRILGDDNVVGQCRKEIREDDFGWIVTQEKMEMLGYNDPSHYPLFINMSDIGDMDNIQSWDVPSVNGNMFIPVPVLAVVHQLPDMLDFLAPQYFYNQWRDPDRPFNISNHVDYFSDLNYVVTDTSGVASQIDVALHNDGIEYDSQFEISVYKYTMEKSYCIRISLHDSVPANVNRAAKCIEQNIPEAYRIYQWNFGKGAEPKSDYLTLLFNELNMVGDFSKWAKYEYGVQIDMAQIEAKNNFNTFNILASVLCAAIMIISVLFVAIFLWFLIDAHFKSISKNLGTIMAFGLPNSTIISIYRTVFLRMILLALAISVVALLIVQLLLLLVGLTREYGMQYINILDIWVWIFIIVVPLLTSLVVTMTMNKKLEAKPGDLIFERNF